MRPIATNVIILVAVFLTVYFIAGDDGAPGGPLFALLCTFTASSASGKLVGALGLRLPPLLGMLCAGFALRNLPEVGKDLGGAIHSQTSSALRNVALVLILCRAGLGMDVQALWRLRFVVARLSLLPCLTEATVIAGLAMWLLDFPLAWGAMLGFVVAAVSPAVVVPSLLALQEQGYGVATGIPTMVVAAAALDDVFSIAGFGICLGLALNDSDGSSLGRWLNVARAPLELLLGIMAGLLGALVLMVLVPAKKMNAEAEEKEKVPAAAALWTQRNQLLVLMSLALAASFGLKEAGFSGASALAVLVLSAAAARGWGTDTSKRVAATLGEAWTLLAQPLLFGLVGAAVSLDDLEPRAVGFGVLMLACSLPVRFCATYLAVMGRGLRRQERLFTALAWMPKATVQAAVGAIALDEASTKDEEDMGTQVLAIAVLAILCTAPLGAVVISLTGPKLLLREEEHVVDETPPAKTAEAKTATGVEDARGGVEAVVVKDLEEGAQDFQGRSEVGAAATASRDEFPSTAPSGDDGGA